MISRNALSFSLLALAAMASAATTTALPGRMLSRTGALYGGVVGFNPDGTNLFNLTPNTFDNGTTHSFFGRSVTRLASVSDDGKTMVALSNREGGPQLVYAFDGTGANPRRLTSAYFEGYGDDAPVISPDGKRIAFISYREEVPYTGGSGVRNPQLYVVNVDGTGLRQITTGTPKINPDDYPTVRTFSVDWSPDSRQVAYRGVRIVTVDDQGHLGYRSVFGTLNVDTGADRVFLVAQSTGQAFSLDWSPSGRYIVGGFGDEAQSAPQGRVFIHDTQTGTTTEDFRVGDPGGQFQIRIAPDDSAYIVAYQGPGIITGYRIVSLTSSEVRSVDFPAVAYAELYWQPGRNWPKPTRLVASPSLREIPRNYAGLLQLNADLYGDDGTLMSRMPQKWEYVSSTAAGVSPWGDLEDRQREGGSCVVRATNAGLTADALVIVGKARLVFDNVRVYEDRDNWYVRVRSRNLGDARAGDGGGIPANATLGGVPMTYDFGSVARDPGPDPDLQFKVAKSAVGSGTKVMTISGSYVGGSYSATLRVTLPSPAAR